VVITQINTGLATDYSDTTEFGKKGRLGKNYHNYLVLEADGL